MRTGFGERATGAILAALLLATGYSAACNGHNGNTSSLSPQRICAPSEQQAPAVTGSGALIVTDISGSMKGFVAPQATRLYTVHDALERALRNALGSVGSDAAIRRCDLGSSLECQSPHAKEDMDKMIYTASQSRLDLFFASGQAGRVPSEKASPEARLIDPYRVAVLVTDGMEAHSTGSGDNPCLGGADPECIAYLLKQHVSAGYGVWLAMLLLPFNGTQDAERPLDNTQWQRIQQHLATLKQNPFFQGVEFKVDRLKSAAPFRTYHYQGVKPFLVIALSRDWRAGRDFVRQFIELVEKEAVTQPANGGYWIELAPIPSQTLQITNLKQSASAANANIRVIDRKRKDGFYDFLIECEREGETTFILEAKRTEAGQTVLDGLQVEFNLVNAEDRETPLESLTFKNPLMPGDEAGVYQAEVVCNCKPMKTGEHQQWLKLQANLKADPSASSPWVALHADNTYEAPERLYGLKDIVQKVLELTTKEPRPTDCLRFRIDRK